MNKKIIGYILIAAIFIFGACDLPIGSDDAAVQQAAAETVAAQLAQALQDDISDSGQSDDEPTATDVPSDDGESADPTNTSPPPTDTPVPPTATTEQVCDLAGFIKDVTIPDGTIMAPGEAFTKTWRLVNNGSCDWTSGYQLVFFSGDQMGGTSPQQLTNGIVSPGQTLDVSVNLTAPGSAGTYKGNWKIKNPSGEIFSLNGSVPFFAEIKVVNPTALIPSITTIVLTDTQEGSVRSDGQLNGNPNVGDLADHRGSQAFARFNISSIPSNATITDIEVNFTSYDTLGNPFSSLGCLRTYAGNFFPLGAGDYFFGAPTGALTRWCNAGELSSISNGSSYFISQLQSNVGSNYFEIRIHFKDKQSDNDATGDMVRFGTMKLTVTYTTP